MSQWKPNVTVAAVIERDGHFLMVEERVGERLVLNQPAGHLEAGESLVEAVMREVREETTRHFTPTALVGIYRLVQSGDLTYLRVCFTGTCGEPVTTISLDPDIVDTHWLSRDELVSSQRHLRSDLVRRCIDDYVAGARYPLGILRDEHLAGR